MKTFVGAIALSTVLCGAAFAQQPVKIGFITTLSGPGRLYRCRHS